MQIGPNVKSVCDEITEKFSPEELYLFNIKRKLTGEVKSFKVCAVIDTENKAETEKQIYLTVESDVPYDVLVYSTEEWDSLLLQKNSFAKRIKEDGKVLYGSEKKPGGE